MTVCRRWNFVVVLAGLLGWASEPVSAGVPDLIHDWYQWPVNGHYYALTLEPEFWIDAEAEALAVGPDSHLVTIDDAAEGQWLKDAGGGAFLGNNRYIGLYQDPLATEPADGWMWADGTPLGYTNWRPGDPDNADGDEDFAVIMLTEGIGSDFCHWNSVTEPHQYHGIIEVVPEPGTITMLILGAGVFLIRGRSR